MKSIKNVWVKCVSSVKGGCKKLSTRFKSLSNTKQLALVTAAGVAIFAIIIVLAIAKYPAPSTTSPNEADNAVVELIIDQATVDRYPFVKNGVISWTQLLIDAPPELLAELDKNGLSLDDIKSLARQELEQQKSFLLTLPVGTKIENSYLKNGRVHWYSGYTVREGDQLFLRDDKGRIWLKTSCANPVVVPETKPEPKPKPDPCPPPKVVKEPINSSPRTTPFDLENESTQPVQPRDLPENTEEEKKIKEELLKKTAPTTDYEPKNVEEIEESRGISTDEGKPTTGQPGTGTTEEAKTPTGSTVQPDGSTIHAPEPSPKEEPAPPPPKADVDGSVPEP